MGVEHAQGALLAQEAGGGTPLSDALALGRTLVESQPTEPPIVTITDDMPYEVKATYRVDLTDCSYVSRLPEPRSALPCKHILKVEQEYGTRP